METVWKPTNAMDHGTEPIHGREELRMRSPRVEAQKTHSQRLESIGMLASGVAHELNNPLGVVMSLAHLIEDDANSSAKLQGFAAIIMAETTRMADIVRNLLNFSRHDTLSAHPTDIHDLVNRTLSLMRSTFRKDQIEVIAEIPEGLPAVRCRSQQIQQVLMNLLTNARDALNDRFPGASPDKVIRIAAKLFEHAGGTWVRLTVEDRGSGYPPRFPATCSTRSSRPSPKTREPGWASRSAKGS